MSIKILLDEDTQLALARAFRQRGFQAVHIAEIERKGFSDLEQLEYAVHHQYCFFTFNKRDFVQLHTRYIAAGKTHYGVIASPQLSISEIVGRLGALAKALPVQGMQNELRFL
jgi:predicted nuclease of predicted toxin-antitoxin system